MDKKLQILIVVLLAATTAASSVAAYFTYKHYKNTFYDMNEIQRQIYSNNNIEILKENNRLLESKLSDIYNLLDSIETEILSVTNKLAHSIKMSERRKQQEARIKEQERIQKDLLKFSPRNP